VVQPTSRSAGDQSDAVRNQFAQESGLPFLEDICFVASLPKTGVGKLDKKVIRKLLVNG
jgi:non-ribosomal peptide synthetase component E (peptide arylation enzyme)